MREPDIMVWYSKTIVTMNRLYASLVWCWFSCGRKARTVRTVPGGKLITPNFAENSKWLIPSLLPLVWASKRASHVCGIWLAGQFKGMTRDYFRYLHPSNQSNAKKKTGGYGKRRRRRMPSSVWLRAMCLSLSPHPNQVSPFMRSWNLVRLNSKTILRPQSCIDATHTYCTVQ